MSPEEKAEAGGPHAIPRRHAPLEQLVRQGSFRGFPTLSQKNSPFKRQLSLRLNELPSTLQRKGHLGGAGEEGRFGGGGLEARLLAGGPPPCHPLTPLPSAASAGAGGDAQWGLGRHQCPLQPDRLVSEPASWGAPWQCPTRHCPHGHGSRQHR